MTARSFAFTKIVVADLEASEQFFTRALGLERVTYIEFGAGVDQLQEVILTLPNSGAGRANLQLIHYPNRPIKISDETVLGFVVDDADATVAALTEAGAKLTIPTLEMTDHRLKLAYVEDLDGHIIEVLQQM